MQKPDSIFMPQPRVGHRLQATSDVDEQARAGTFSDWAQAYQQLSNGRYVGVVEDLVMPALVVLRETGNRIVFEAGTLLPGAHALGVAAAMSGEAYFCGRGYHAGSLSALRPGQEFEMRTADRFEIVAAVFDPASLSALARQPGLDAGALEAALRAMPTVCDSVHGTRLVHFLRALLEAADAAPAMLASWAAQAQIADELLELAAACALPQGRRATRGVGAGRERVVRRVRQYLQGPVDESVNVAAICGELGVTRRTLQNSVQDVLGVSPHAYLKAVRLNGVRRALKHEARAQHSIADIAAQWGFWHRSQFALDYRRLFGERPSQTRSRLAG